MSLCPRRRPGVGPQSVESTPRLMLWVSEDPTSPRAASVSGACPDTPADFPSQVTRPDGGVALAASRSRSNEPPRQIEDGAHKLLRAAASCACLELARARRRHLKPARPQRCQSLARAACSTLGWLLSLLNWTKVPHALSGHPVCWSRSNGRSLAGDV